MAAESNTCLEHPIRMSSQDFKHRFIIIRQIGKGAFGVVNKVVDDETDEVLAMKNVDLDLEEIRIMCALISRSEYTWSLIMIKNFVIVEDTGMIYLLIPFLTQRLFDLIDQNITPKDVLCIVFELIIAILAMEQLTIVHNDLKEDNIMIKRTDVIRCYTINDERYFIDCSYLPIIIDFGLATQHETYTNDWIGDGVGLKFVMMFLRDIASEPLDRKLLEHIMNPRELIYSSAFDVLKHRTTHGGDTIKFFEPVNIS
jgi:serine/threonine protein kinase